MKRIAKFSLKAFKVVVRACYGAYFVAHIWRQILFPGDLHDAAF